MPKEFRLSPQEQTLVNAIRECAEFSPTRLGDVIVYALAERNVKALLVFLGLGDYPVLASSLSKDDLSSMAVNQVTANVLGRLGLSLDVVPYVSTLAGTVFGKGDKRESDE